MQIGYARVSRADQTLEQQTDALTAAGCERIYAESISSRVDMAERPEWRRLADSLRPGDVVVCVRYDRLGRGLLDLLQTLKELEARGVKVRSLAEEFGTGPAASLMLHMAAAFSEYERALISERTKEQLSAARARGRKGGRRPAVPNPADRAALLSLYSDPDVSRAYIAAKYGIGVSTVHAIAKAERERQRPQSEKSLCTSEKGGGIVDPSKVLPADGNARPKPQKSQKGKKTVTAKS